MGTAWVMMIGLGVFHWRELMRPLSHVLAMPVDEHWAAGKLASSRNYSVKPESVKKGGLRSLSLVWLALVCVLPVSIQAHPHAWIDLDIELLTDAEGHIHAMDQVWVIDPMYSRYLYEDAMEHFDGATPEEKLLNLGREISENLHEYAWYTELLADGQPVQGYAASEVFMRMEDRNLLFGFRLNLERTLDPRAELIRYAIFDPTYFIEIIHSTSQPPRLDTEACNLRVERPRPDPRIVARALAIDFNQTGDADLGQYFAERVEVQCPPVKSE